MGICSYKSNHLFADQCFSQGQDCAGDIKLSAILGLMLDTYFQLFNALSYTWIIGGIYALLMGSKTIAFAPFMICGTYLAKIF